MRNLAEFLAELKRRRVFRVAVVYAGVAFIIIQIIDGAFDYLPIPDWVGTAIIVLLLVGFPVAVGLAWAFDITEKGVVRAKAQDAAAPQCTPRPIFGNLTLAIVAAVAVAVAVWSWWGRPDKEAALGAKSIAVLPFVNFSEEEGDWFSDGITDDILTHLSKISDLKVIGRTSVMQYKNTTKRLRDIGEELGVATLLEGSVRRADSRVRITSQLVDAKTEEHLWAETYDRDLTDIFAIQSDVAHNIAAALKAILSPEERQRIGQRPTESTAAYDYYLRASEYERQSYERKAFEIAIDLYQKAVAIDSTFAQAYARLGYNHAGMYWFGYDRTSQRLVMAREAVDQALSIKPDDPVVRMANGFYYYYGSRDYARALEEFYFAQRMEPGNGLHAENIAWIQRRLGRLEESLANLKTALKYDPRSSMLTFELGLTYNVLRLYDLAEQSFDRAIVLAPDFSWPYRSKAWLQVYRTGNTENARQVLAEGMLYGDPNLFSWTLVNFDIEDSNYNAALDRLTAIPEDVQEGQGVFMPKEFYVGRILKLMGEPAAARRHFENARALLEEKVRESPTDYRVQAASGWVYAHLGLADKAIREGRKAVDLLPVSLDAWLGPTYIENLAEIYTIVGEYDEALDILEHLLEISGYTSVGELRFRRVWDPLREHPRFKALVSGY